jgi:hypothetical protein
MFQKNIAINFRQIRHFFENIVFNFKEIIFQHFKNLIKRVSRW